jgi:MFS family permease
VAMQGVGAGTLMGPLIGGALYAMKGQLINQAIPMLVIAFVLFLCFILELKLMSDGVIPWFKHPTPPDEARNNLDTPNSGHEAGVQMPKDWAGQRRPATSRTLRVTRDGTYRTYPSKMNIALQEVEMGEASSLLTSTKNVSILGKQSAEEEDPRVQQLRDYAKQLYGATSSEGVEEEEEERRVDSGGCSDLLTNKYIALGWILQFQCSLILGALEVAIPLLMSYHYHSQPLYIGLVLVSGFAAYLWATPIAVRVSNKIGRPAVVLIGLVLAVIGLATIRAIANQGVVILGMVLLGMGLGCMDTPSVLIMNSHAAADGKESYDTYTAQDSAVVLGFVVGPILAGFLKTQLSYSLSLDVLAAMCAFTIPMLLALFMCGNAKKMEEAKYVEVKSEE